MTTASVPPKRSEFTRDTTSSCCWKGRKVQLRRRGGKKYRNKQNQAHSTTTPPPPIIEVTRHSLPSIPPSYSTIYSTVIAHHCRGRPSHSLLPQPCSVPHTHRLVKGRRYHKIILSDTDHEKHETTQVARGNKTERGPAEKEATEQRVKMGIYTPWQYHLNHDITVSFNSYINV